MTDFNNENIFKSFQNFQEINVSEIWNIVIFQIEYNHYVYCEIKDYFSVILYTRTIIYLS